MYADSFMNTTGFLNFYIAALITGSILGMNRTLLLRAAVRFLPVALCAMTFAILLVGGAGMLLGYGFSEAIMYVAIPMMGGGMGAGVVPLSGMYAEALGQDSAVIISRMIPASTLGNVTAIIGAGLLARLGQAKPGLTGNGKLMRKNSEDMKEGKPLPTSVEMMGTGMILSISFYLLGTVLGKLVPAIHTYAWMIIMVAAAKARKMVHDMRHNYMGIMAGIGTVLADDPMLNVRLEGKKSPVRIICDSSLRIPLESKICRTAQEYKTIVACGTTGEPEQKKAECLKKMGVQVVSFPDSRGKVDLSKLMEYLGGSQGIDSILLEGGGELNDSALRAGIVKEVKAFVSPRIFGGAGAKSPVEGIGVEAVQQAVELWLEAVTPIGEDLLMEYRIK